MAASVHSGEASRLTAGVPEALAERAGVWPLLHTGFDVVEVADAHGRDVADVAAVEWRMFDRLDLRGCGTASARCPARTAGRPRPDRRCATTC